MTVALDEHLPRRKVLFSATWNSWACKYKARNNGSDESLMSKIIAALAAVVCGVLVSFIYGVLSIMKQKLGDPLLVGLISYLGALILSMIILPSPVAKHYSKLQTDRPEFEWWMFSGGILGVSKMSLISLAANQLTDALILVTLSYNLGQLICAYITDHFGFLGTPQRHFTQLKLAALILFAGGLLCFSVENNKLEFRVFTLVSFVAGVTTPIQSCVNRRTGDAMPYRPQASMVNYFGGFSTLASIWLVIFLAKEGKNSIQPLEWFYYIIPAIAGYFVLFCYYFFAPKLGLALFAMIIIFTEIVTSVIVDQTGIFRKEGMPRAITWNVGLGFTIAFAATVFAAFAQNKQESMITDEASAEKHANEKKQSDIVENASFAACEDCSEIVDESGQQL